MTEPYDTLEEALSQIASASTKLERAHLTITSLGYADTPVSFALRAAWEYASKAERVLRAMLAESEPRGPDIDEDEAELERRARVRFAELSTPVLPSDRSLDAEYPSLAQENLP